LGKQKWLVGHILQLDGSESAPKCLTLARQDKLHKLLNDENKTISYGNDDCRRHELMLGPGECK
jgi:hypothetical protein